MHVLPTLIIYGLVSYTPSSSLRYWLLRHFFTPLFHHFISRLNNCIIISIMLLFLRYYLSKFV